MKKIVSVVLFLTILISCAPMALASSETVIPLSATEKTIVGYGEGSQEAAYSITDCHGSSFTFGELSQYKMYQLPLTKDILVTLYYRYSEEGNVLCYLKQI